MQKNDLSTLLKDKGFKCTPARVSILKIFTKNHIPLNAETVLREIKKQRSIKNINEATVYRTLSAFEKSGILKIVDLRKDSVYFELNNDHHHHIVCTK